MLCAFTDGRTHHGRDKRSRIISVTVYIYTMVSRDVLCHVMSGSATCPFLVQK